jgi:hypothetical protein
MTIVGRTALGRRLLVCSLAAGSVVLSCGGSERTSGGDDVGGSAGADASETGSGGSESTPGSGGTPGGGGAAGTDGQGGSPGSGGSNLGGDTASGGVGTGGEADTGGSSSGGTGGASSGGTGGPGSGGTGGAGGSATGGAVAGGGEAGSATGGAVAAGGAGGSAGLATGGAESGGAAGSAGSLGVGGVAGGGAGGQPDATGGSAGAAGEGGGWGWPGTVDSCEDATDEHLLAVVYDGPKVPEGMYDGDGRTGSLLTWEDGCATDIALARVMAGAELGSWDSESIASPYYYEFTSGTAPDEHVYRVTRCEFFDGTVLGEPYRDWEGARLLASYLWFIENRSNASAKLVAGAYGPSAAAYEFSLCFTMTVYGDWGLYDEITYYERHILVGLTGVVSIDADESLRTIEGQYNPNP